jgi:DNA-binding XRE family transcriptional regulator
MGRLELTEKDINKGKRLAERIKKSRENFPYKQTELAQAAKISIDTLRKLESGSVSAPNVFLISKLAKILEKDIREWLE